jgi:hypothetical protein
VQSATRVEPACYLARVRILVVAALAVAALSIFFILNHSAPASREAAPAANLAAAESTGSQVTVTETSDGGGASPSDPQRIAAAAPAPKPLSAPPAAPRIESAESLPPGHPHFLVMSTLMTQRQEAVDRCRAAFKLPGIERLLDGSSVIREMKGAVRKEASLWQKLVFEISTSRDGYVLESARVVETKVEFAASDGTLRRASLVDASLDRCVEHALEGARVDAPRDAPSERFTIEGRPGDGEYDLQ